MASSTLPPRGSESGGLPRESARAPAAPSQRPRSLRPGPPNGGEPMVLDAEPGAFLFGSWRNVFVAVWESQATTSAVDRMFASLAALPWTRSHKRSEIHLIAQGARLPEQDVREHYIELVKAHEAHVACVGVVIGGTGFWASALRSFVTGLHWLSPRSFDFRLLGSIEEASSWLPAEHLNRTGLELDPSRLQLVLQEWAAPRLHLER